MKRELLEGEVIGLSVKDFFTKDMLKIAILPLAFYFDYNVNIFFIQQQDMDLIL